MTMRPKFFMISYEVKGFEGTCQAGPYAEDEVDYHVQDIEGYEGVRNVRVVPDSAVDQLAEIADLPEIEK